MARAGPFARLSITRCSVGDERVTRSDVRLEHLTRHFPPDHVVKRLAHAVRRHEVVGIDLLECRDHLPKVVVVQRRNEMEAADHRVYDAAWACLIVLMIPRWLHEVTTTNPLPLSMKLVPISCSKSSGTKVPVFFAGVTL